MRQKGIPGWLVRQVAPVLLAFSRPLWREYALQYGLGRVLVPRFGSIMEVGRCIGDGNGEALHHFLQASPWDERGVEQAMRNQVAASIHPMNTRPVTLILDDTVIERNGKHIEGIGVHHSGNGLVKGQCAVTSVIRIGRLMLSWAVRGYCPKKGCPRGQFRSKVDLAVDILRDTVHLGRPVTVVMDTWYACKRIFEVISQHGWRYVAAIKSNRIIRVHGRKTHVRALAKGPREYQTVRLANKRCLRVAKKLVTLPHVGTVALFITKSDNATKYLVSNDTTLSGRQAVLVYAQRSWIETFHRDIKQHLGFGEVWMRSWRAVQRHWTVTVMMYNALQLWNAAVPWRSRKRSFRQTIRAFRRSLTGNHAMLWCDRYAIAA